MGFLDFLSPALTVGTQAAGTYEQAKAQANDRNTKNFMQSAMLLKSQHDDEVSNQLRGAQTAEASARTNMILNPAETWGDFEDVLNPTTGKLERVQRSSKGNTHVIGLAAPKAPPQIVSPGQGVRNESGGYDVPIAREPSLASQLAAQSASDKKEQRLSAAEAWWNSNSGGAANAQASDTFKAMRAAHPTADAREIMAATKDAITSGAGLAQKQASTDATKARAQNGANFTITDGKFSMGAPTGAPTATAKPAPARPAAKPVDQATWAARNPPLPNESREAYKARYAATVGAP